MENTVFDKKLRVLLVDDDMDDRELFAEAVAEVDASIEVRSVEDGEAMMNELNNYTNPPDVIFLDLNMPRKNGKECLLEIQEHQDFKNIPIIIYSTSISNKDIHEPWSKGALCFIRKPDSFSMLKEIVKKIITPEFFITAIAKEEKILFNLQ